MAHGAAAFAAARCAWGAEGSFAGLTANVPEAGEKNNIRNNNMIEETKLAAYIKKYGEHWADEMPENCPPEDVCTADNDVFYRFTKKEDVIEPRDWMNYRTLYPKRRWTKE